MLAYLYFLCMVDYLLFLSSCIFYFTLKSYHIRSNCSITSILTNQEYQSSADVSLLQLGQWSSSTNRFTMLKKTQSWKTTIFSRTSQ